MQSANEQFKLLKDEFLRISKNVNIYKTENRTLPASEKITRDVTSLFNAYDNLITLLKIVFHDQGQEQQEFLTKSVEHFFKPKLIETLAVYKLTVLLPNKFECIARNTLIAYTEGQSSTENIDAESSTRSDSNSLRRVNLIDPAQQIDATASASIQLQNDSQLDNFESADSENSDASSSHTVIDATLNENLNNQNNSEILQQIEQEQHLEQPTAVTMVQTTGEFLNQAGKILNYKYDGNPTKLASFIDDIEIVEGLVEANNEIVKAFCVKYVKSKLEGCARECIPDEVATTEAIKTNLRAEIKAESSKIVEGKMTALRLQRGDFSKYHEEAEKLAEQLRRSLISEGFAKTKANELTIDKTIEMCRKSARNDVVKSVISSTHYSTPGEVIAKFITQNDIVKREMREKETYKSFKPNNKFNKNGQQQYQNDRKQNYNKNGQQNKNFSGNRNERSYNKNFKRTNDNARGKFNKNEHTIRIVSNSQPNTYREADQPSNSNGESFFRISN